MEKNILNRLSTIESRLVKEPLIVLAKTDRGDLIEIPMRECIERKDTHFCKVVRGSNLQDLDLWLEELRKSAFEETED